MNIQEIINEVKSHFTGDRKHDFNYVKTASREYAKQGNIEVLNALSQLLLEVANNQEMKEIAESMKKDIKTNESLFAKAENLFKSQNNEQAKVVLDKILARVEGKFEDDDTYAYVNIEDAFAFQIYANIVHKSDKIVRLVPDHYYKYYYLHGVVSNKLGLHRDAFDSYVKALRWFPNSFPVLTEVANIAILDKEYDKALDLFKQSWSYCFVPSELSRLYRGVGYLHFLKEEYEVAMSAYLVSTVFDRNVNVSKELGVIAQKMGQTEFKPLTPQESRDHLAKIGFGFGANMQLIGMATALSQQFENQGQYQTALYFLRIAVSLAPTEESRNRLASLEEKIKTKN